MSDIFISVLVDRSGSMSNIWKDTLGGLETFRKEQVEEDGTTWLSLFGFDAPRYSYQPVQVWNSTWGQSIPASPMPVFEDEWFTKVYEAWNAKDVPDLTNLTAINPRGATALLDAIAKTIAHTETLLAERPWFDGTVLVVIQTDGYENSSREYNVSQIKDLIGKKESQGWQIVFMGAGIDAIAEGQGIGLRAGTSFAYDATSVGTRAAYNTLSSSTSGLRASGVKRTDAFWQEPVDSEATK